MSEGVRSAHALRSRRGPLVMRFDLGGRSERTAQELQRTRRWRPRRGAPGSVLEDPFAAGATEESTDQAMRRLEQVEPESRRVELRVALWAGREDRDMLEAWDQAGALVPEAQREDTAQFLEIFRHVGRLLGDETAMKVRSAMIRKHGAGVHPSWIAYEEALRAKGQAEGQAKGQRAALRVILERRLRGAASEILERLTSADEDQVLRLAELLGTDLADQELRSAIEALLPRRK